MWLPRRVNLAKLRPWERVENMHFQSSFDFGFQTVWTGAEVVEGCCQAFVNDIAQHKDVNVKIQPGSYTVTADINLRFVKRPDEEK